jgi:hypothetical protein
MPIDINYSSGLTVKDAVIVVWEDNNVEASVWDFSEVN